MFEIWGEMTDIYIAGKKLNGKIFVFVMFGDLKDEKQLEEHCKDIWFDFYKTWVNISIFKKPFLKNIDTINIKEKLYTKSREKEQGNDLKNIVHFIRKQHGIRIGGKTYLEVTKIPEVKNTKDNIWFENKR